jgi:hypothetical protein
VVGAALFTELAAPPAIDEADVAALDTEDAADVAIADAEPAAEDAAPIAEFAPPAISVEADAAAAAGSTGGVTGSMVSLAPPPQAAARAKGAKTKYLSIGIISEERALVPFLVRTQRKNIMRA